MIQLPRFVTDRDAQNLLGVRVGMEGHVKEPGANLTLCGKEFERSCPCCGRWRGVETFKTKSMLELHLSCGECARIIREEAAA